MVELSEKYRAVNTLWDFVTWKHEPLHPADVAVVMGSALKELVPDYAANLFDQGLYDLAICTGGRSGATLGWKKTEAEVFAARLRKRGVPTKEERLANNIGENLLNARRRLIELGRKHGEVIIIPHPIATRRAFLSALKQWELPQPKFQVTAPDYPLREQNLVQAARLCVGEMERLIVGPSRGFTAEAPITPELLDAYEFLLNNGFEPRRKAELASVPGAYVGTRDYSLF